MKKTIFVTLTPDWTWPEDFLTCWFPEQTWNEDQEMSEEKLDRFFQSSLIFACKGKSGAQHPFYGQFPGHIFVTIFD